MYYQNPQIFFNTDTLVFQGMVKGKKMKSISDCLIKIVLTVLLGCFVVLPLGCAQLGETTAEGNRRHVRNLRINNQQMMGDIDRVILFDEPSRLSDKRIP